MLTVIIVDYKSIEKTIDYIFHLIKKIRTNGILNFVIVDNDEKSHEMTLNQSLSFLKLVSIDNLQINCYSIGKNIVAYYCARENLGYAKGNNCGCKIAKRLFKSRYYLISNNDLELTNELNWESIRIFFESNPKIGIIGPKVVSVDGLPQSPHKKPTALGTLMLYYWSMATKNRIIKYSDIDYNDSSKFCYRVMGCFMFINAELFWNCNGFDERTFLYAEELILAEKFSRNNILTYFDMDYLVVHRHGETLKNTANVLQGFIWSYESNRYYFKEYRNYPEILLKLSDVNFKLFCWLYKKTH